jgi:uncharacterized membrane protein (UPF0127 family)
MSNRTTNSGIRRTPAPIAALIASSIIALGAASCDSANSTTHAEVTVAGKVFHCRISADDATREKGLGGVASLAPDEGMIFVFADSRERSFWMVDCIMDIDIAFIDPSGFVTAVHTMPKEPLRGEGESVDTYYSRLKRYPSAGPAQFALEVAPGTLRTLGIRRGSRLEFDRDSLKTLAK